MNLEQLIKLADNIEFDENKHRIPDCFRLYNDFWSTIFQQLDIFVPETLENEDDLDNALFKQFLIQTKTIIHEIFESDEEEILSLIYIDGEIKFIYTQYGDNDGMIHNIETDYSRIIELIRHTISQMPRWYSQNVLAMTDELEFNWVTIVNGVFKINDCELDRYRYSKSKLGVE